MKGGARYLYVDRRIGDRSTKVILGHDLGFNHLT